MTDEEIEFIFKNGYTIRSQWISPMERIEYRISRLGSDEILAFRKSERAAYNFIRKEVEKQKIND